MSTDIVNKPHVEGDSPRQQITAKQVVSSQQLLHLLSSLSNIIVHRVYVKRAFPVTINTLAWA